MKTNEKFGHCPVYSNVNKNNDYGIVKHPDGSKTPRKFIKVRFTNTQFSHAEGSNKVECTVECVMDFDIPFYWNNGLTAPCSYTATATAVCAEGDKFNLSKGKLIAQAKAENRAYKIACNMLNELKAQLNNFANAIDQPITLIQKYTEHNNEYIDRVVDGSIIPKY